MTTLFIVFAVMFLFSVWTMHHALTGGYTVDAAPAGSIIFLVGLTFGAIAMLGFAFVCGMSVERSMAECSHVAHSLRWC